MTGRHRATPGAVTEPMRAVRRPLPPPIDPEPETATMPRITADGVAEWDAWAQLQKERDPDAYMEPLRHGGTRTERRMRATMRERGQLLAKRVGDAKLKVRRALARMKGGRS